MTGSSLRTNSPELMNWVGIVWKKSLISSPEGRGHISRSKLLERSLPCVLKPRFIHHSQEPFFLADSLCLIFEAQPVGGPGNSCRSNLVCSIAPLR